MKAAALVLSAAFLVSAAAPAYAQLGALGKIKKGADTAADAKQKADKMHISEKDERNAQSLARPSDEQAEADDHDNQAGGVRLQRAEEVSPEHVLHARRAAAQRTRHTGEGPQRTREAGMARHEREDGAGAEHRDCGAARVTEVECRRSREEPHPRRSYAWLRFAATSRSRNISSLSPPTAPPTLGRSRPASSCASCIRAP